MIDKIIPLWLKDRLLQSIWIAISSLIALSWLLPESNILIQAISQILTPILVKITLSLLLLCIGLIASLTALYLKLRAKPNLDNYDYIEDPGFYIHKKTNIKYCGKCLDQDKLSRLSFHNEKGLICRQCNEPYVAPYDYESAWKQANLKDSS